MIVITLDVRPIAKQSTRFTRSGHAYRPKNVVEFHRYLRRAVPEQLPAGFVPFAGAIRVRIAAIFAIPASRPAKERNIVAGGGSVPKPTKPDVDNLMKATLDPLNGLVWRDDAQIAEASIAKRWGIRDQLIISVSALEPDTSGYTVGTATLMALGG